MLKSTISSKSHCTSFSKIASFHCCAISCGFFLLSFVVICCHYVTLVGVYLYDDLVM